MKPAAIRDAICTDALRGGRHRTRRQIQQHFGINDPHAESERGRVWRISDALASLVRDHHLIYDDRTGLYYGVSA